MRLAYIQVLRFLAATAVVLFHSLGTDSSYAKGQESLLFQHFDLGYLGVDLFFVISGFVIYLSAAKPGMTASNFLLRRLERIIPIYWAVTLAVVFLLLFVPGVFKGSFDYNASLIIRSFLFVSFAGNNFPIIYPGWSLEYEMFFYLSVAALMVVARRSTWNLISVLFALLVVSGLMVDVQRFDVVNLLGFATKPMVIEFILGITVARLYRGDTVPAFVWAVLVAVLAALVVMDPTNRATVAGLPAAVAVFAAAKLSTRWSTDTPLVRLLARLGDASYSIYLIQNLAISATDKMVVKVLPSINLDVLIIITTVATTAFGYLVYVGVEKPMLRALRAWNPMLVPVARTGRDRDGRSPDPAK